jgi:hypothetical protein
MRRLSRAAVAEAVLTVTRIGGLSGEVKCPYSEHCFEKVGRS